MADPATIYRTLAAIVGRTDMRALVGRYASLAERSGRYATHCLFHASTTPSMIVDTALKVCFCRECDGQWGPVDFLMAMEHISYAEALARLADAAGIALPEGFAADVAALVATPAAADAPAVTPSMMFEANRHALGFFRRTLIASDEGQSVGMAYFRERGINDAMVDRFQLGYSPEQQRSALTESARRAGIRPEVLASVGLVVERDHGEYADRYRGRVVFPVFTVTGEPVAFGARTLRTSKDVAKYVNSPESEIYSKSNELYGLWQARDAIVERGRCILVEGYMDVISMHQAGIENVVAASGTSLTEGQVALLHRFTDSVTVIFDADSAGVKASVRSIDMLLSADMKVELVSLPEGEDPDSFARAHSRREIEDYLASHAIDFIEFKLRLAAAAIRRDPIERARLISDIISSIATVPDRRRMREFITRTAFLLKINEKPLVAQLMQRVGERMARRAQRKPGNAGSADGLATDNSQATALALRPKEEELLGYIVRNATSFFCDTVSEDGSQITPTNVIEYIEYEMKIDSLKFVNPDFATVYNAALSISAATVDDDFDDARAAADEARARLIETRRRELMEREADMLTLEREEKLLAEEAEELWNETYGRICGSYVARVLMASPDEGVRRLATRFVAPRTLLSKIHTRTSTVETESDRLVQIIPHALCVLKAAVIKIKIDDINRRMTQTTDFDQIRALLESRMRLDALKSQLAPYIGDRVIN